MNAKQIALKEGNRPRKQRGTRKKKGENNGDEIKIYYNNINGLTSKKDSLNHILQMVKPEVVALCETKLHANSTFELEDYKTLKSNLKAGKEGILIAARKGTFKSIEIIFESEAKNIATAEIEYPEEMVRVVVVHGPQEDDSQEDKDDFYNDLAGEIERCIAAERKLIIAGDLNARLDQSRLNEVKGNGKRLKEVVERYDLKVLNFGQETEGKWTRIQIKDGVECKSQIDYIITDEVTQKKQIKTSIDEEKMITPYRTKKDGNKKSITFSDHCAISTSFSITKGASKTTDKNLQNLKSGSSLMRE